MFAEHALDRVLREALGAAERLERVEDIRRQHAAEVDQQALHDSVIRFAASASCATPSPKPFR
jgi:hypothetical protein